MRIGYACLALGVPGSELRSCALKNADGPRLAALIARNLSALSRMVDYNLENGIRLYRISSGMIPFGSSPVNQLDWANLFAADLARIGARIRAGGMRVSMHPGQYTVLSAPDESVAARSVEDLRYHARVLDALGAGEDAKIILHLGGAYGDKAAALQRFEARFRALDPAVRRRVALENDDRLFTIADALALGRRLGAPVVFDNLHHAVNPSGPAEPRRWIDACRETWKPGDGPQKIHYAQQDPEKQPGAHARTIAVREFLDFARAVGRGELDIMLEVKDKNLSAVKCALCARADPAEPAPEKEWVRYEYAVLEHSPPIHRALRAGFRDQSLPILAFYEAVERAFALPIEPGNAADAARRAWESLRDGATQAEQKAFQAALGRYLEGRGTLDAVKRRLYAAAERCGAHALLESCYWGT